VVLRSGKVISRHPEHEPFGTMLIATAALTIYPQCAVELLSPIVAVIVAMMALFWYDG
jgi:hypothetical protein